MPRDGSELEIGKAVKPTRQKRAVDSSIPRPESPASAHIEPAATPARRRRTTIASAPIRGSSSVAPIDPTGNGEVGGDGQGCLDAHSNLAIAAIVANLAFSQTLRKGCITAISRCDRSAEDLIVQTLRASDPAMADASKKVLFSAASKIRLAIEKAGKAEYTTHQRTEERLAIVAELILGSAGSRLPHEQARAKIEADMKAQAMSLPIYPWVKENAKGLGPLGLAVLVAEASIPIGDYRSISGLWKHCGLSVENGRAQRLPAKGEGGKGDEAGKVFNARRRAQIWAMCSDTMLRAQWRGDKDADGNNPVKSGKPVAVPAHAIGPYGEVYGRRKSHTAPRIEDTADLPDKIGGFRNPAKWTPARCDADARRIMTKALLRDLWRVWRGMPAVGAGTE